MEVLPLVVKGYNIKAYPVYIVPRAFEVGGIFTVQHLLWHGASVFAISSEGPHWFSPADDKKWVKSTYFDLDPL